MIIQHERPCTGFFEIGQRETGIDGEKRARGVDGFKHEVRSAAAAHAIAKNAQQIAGLGGFAHFDVHDFSGAGEIFDFARLDDIALQQLEVLGGFERIGATARRVAVQHDVVRQRGEHVVGGGLRRNGGHAAEGAQRSGDFDVVFGGSLSHGGERQRGAAGPPVYFQVASRGFPISGDQVECDKPTRDAGAFPGAGVIASEQVAELLVNLTCGGVAVAVQKNGVGLEREGIASVRPRGAVARERSRRRLQDSPARSCPIEFRPVMIGLTPSPRSKGPSRPHRPSPSAAFLRSEPPPQDSGPATPSTFLVTYFITVGARVQPPCSAISFR